VLAGSGREAHAIRCTIGLAVGLLGARLHSSAGIPALDRLPRWFLPAVLRQWGSGSGFRVPILDQRFDRGLIQRLARHWPNAIEATAGVGAPFNDLPRLPVQIAHLAARAGRAVARPWS
jgi:hypothetical protein